MKRTILNLLAVAALSISWTTHAAEAADSDTSDQPVAEASAVPMEAAAEAAPLAVAPASEAPPKTPKSYQRPDPNQPRSMSLDLRHCLELETNAEIAYCAGE